ncbi:MAG: hypothetical protein EXR72_23295 [Myxococcales bacterium]|nr:hypothetical protein [Myxococcales bacterium]
MIAADDDRALRPASYIGTGLLSLLLFAVILAVLFLPPAFAAGFILRGRAPLRIAGFALLLGWFVAIVLVGRRVMAARHSDGE